MKQNNIKKKALPLKKETKPVSPATKNVIKKANKLNFQLAFGTVNYILMGVGIIILALGYILLSGGGSDDPNTFNTDMFDSRRLVVAPILIVLGFVVEIVAIMFKFKGKKQE
jgi:hypothetical protein